MKTTTCVFIDESGDTSIDYERQGVTRRYILAAVMLSEHLVRQQTNAATNIAQEFFSGAEIKSSRVGGNLCRRKAILKKISNLKIKYYAHIIDKELIYKDGGLQFKKTFYKYLNGNLFERLFTNIHKTKVFLDKHGHSDFMESFAKYVKKRLNFPLLDSEFLQYADSKSAPLIQVADFIAGSISRCVEGKDPLKTLNIISKNEIFTYKWPPKVSPKDTLTNLSEREQFDQIIMEQSVKKSKQYIIKNINSIDQETQTKVKTVEYLLHRFFINPNEYVYSDEIIQHLTTIGVETIKRHTLLSGVIAPLRDADVIIASCNKGYKIPNSTINMREFVKTVDGLVVPYIQRLNTAREIMLLASSGKYDIVSELDFPRLNNFINANKYS